MAAGTRTLAEVLQYLKTHPPRVADAVIAERATQFLRRWGINGRHDRVSRPLVCMLRRGQARRAAGIKARAIWEAMAALRVVPGVPQEVLTFHAPTPRREANRAYYWRQQYEALRATLRGGALENEIKEVPMLTPAMIRWFGFERNPVFDEVRSSRDIWWGAQHKEAKGILIDAAESGRFVQLAGRRGSGKTLVAAAAKEELLQREDLILAEPSATITGVLTEMHLLTAVIQAIKRKTEGRDELFIEAQNAAKRALAMRYLLIQQRKANRKVVLWIDEAHELKAGTFLALKRFLDEMDGLGRRLLGIVLIGQHPDASYNPRARDLSEVTLRLQTYRLEPMQEEISDYLRFKIQRAGGSLAEVITPAALKAIAARCPYPLDANVLFAQLLIEAYDVHKEKPIGREHVKAAAEEDPAEAAG